MMEYHDAEGNVWEFRYVVTHGDEGPERMEYRPKPSNEQEQELLEWKKWGEDLPIINEPYNHFHGFYVLAERDLNPDGIPALDQMFSHIRAIAEELQDIAPRTAQALMDYGNVDEPLRNLIRDVLTGELTPHNRALLSHLNRDS